MYNIEKRDSAVLMVSNTKDQTIYEFDSYEDLLDSIDSDFVNDYVVDSFKTKGPSYKDARSIPMISYSVDRLTSRDIKLYAITTVRGEAILTSKILNDLKRYKANICNRKSKKYFIYWRLKNCNYEFRKDPVPGISRYKGYASKNIRTTQELRRNTSPEERKFIRSKRGKNYLPCTWEGYKYNTTCNKRSWKRTKGITKQWMKRLPNRTERTSSLIYRDSDEYWNDLIKYYNEV